MSSPGSLNVGRSQTGFCLRVEGRGTMRESPSVQEFVEQCLQIADVSLVVDLSACDYLDSTFLGCLVCLHRRFGKPNPRFIVAASQEKCAKLLGPTGLQRLLVIIPEAPAVVGSYVPLPVHGADAIERTRHIMECHRQLACIEGPQQAAFANIANQLERELAAKANQS